MDKWGIPNPLVCRLTFPIRITIWTHTLIKHTQISYLQWIGLRENLNRKPSLFPLNMGYFPVIFPLNQSIDISHDICLPGSHEIPPSNYLDQDGRFLKCGTPKSSIWAPEIFH